MAEDAAVLLVPGREDEQRQPDAVQRAGVRGSAQGDAVLRGQVLVHRVHGLPGAPGARRPRDHRPDVGLQVDAALVGVRRAERHPHGRDAAHVPLAVPGALDGLQQQRQLLDAPRRHGALPDERRQLADRPQPVGQQERGEHRLALDTELEAVVPVGGQALHQPVRATVVQREAQRLHQVAQHGVLAGVGVGEDRRQVVQVARLVDQRGDGHRQPERVVAAVLLDFRGALLARGVGQRVHQRQGAALGSLAGEQQVQALAGGVGDGVRHREDVLCRVPEAQAVTVARLDQRDPAGPVERHVRLVGVPHVDHRVELRVRCADLQRRQPRGPLVAQRVDFGGDPRGRRMLRDQVPARGQHAVAVVPRLVGGSDAQGEDDVPGLAGGELEAGVQGRARVVAPRLAAGALALLDGQRRRRGAVGAQERVAVGVERGDLGAAEREPALAGGGARAVDPADEPVAVTGPDHVLAVLQVLQVLAEAPVVRELRVGERRDGPRLVAGVRDPQRPVLERLAPRHEHRHLGVDARVGRLEHRVAEPVADRRAVRVRALERLADWLP